MTAFWALVKKDLQVFLQDRRAMIMAFAAPILIGSFFGFVLGGSTKEEERGKIEVLWVDQDQSGLTETLRGNLSRNANLTIEKADLESARTSVSKGKKPVAIVVPKGFGEAAGGAVFGGGEKPEVVVWYDPSHAVEAGMVQGVLSGEVMQAVSANLFSEGGVKTLSQVARGKLQGSSMPKEQKKSIEDLLDSATKVTGESGMGGGGFALSMPFRLKEEALSGRAGRKYNYYAHAFAGMAMQFMMFTGIDVGIGMLLLRKRGLWRRFRAAPLGKATLLGSRAVSAMLVGMAILGAVFLFARLAFDVRVEGSMLGFVGVCAAASLMAAGYGLLIAALGKSPEAARGLSILVTLLLVMLSGAWVPGFLFPAWLQKVTKLNPVRWAVDGLDAMTWRGMGWDEAWPGILVLLASALVFGAIAVWRWRWEAEG